MPKVSSLGHIGLHVNDFPKMLDFYTRVLGFTVTDTFPPEREAAFLSAQPETEHHELLLTSGRTAPDGAALLQQLSMHVDSLADLKAFHKVFIEEGITEQRIMTHGNTASIYFRDPENNNLEVYFATHVDFPQPFGQPIDIDQDDDAILQQIEDIRKASGKSR